ncbi:hypothetical protein [Bradyrhizobium shewense]|uniref:hypothetical protein n=1 Tax=Bradyrhizobium shewense TaxID=1761772 RepID=UPI00101AD892|nr:hypothetical protein [Bradyrhizobium shewense]
MAESPKPDSKAATQYLTWALEEIEKTGHPIAALHVQIALNDLRSPNSADQNAGRDAASHAAREARRLRAKAEEAEQLAELAVTASRREAIMSMVESYRRTADQLDQASPARDVGTKKK